MPPPTLYDLSEIDFSRPVFDIEAIRRVNPQRNQMEQLTAIVYVDTARHGLVGYKDITEDEFWIAGHMPGFPLMPGVIMCEAAEIRFRGPVFPNCRLVLMARMTNLRPNRRATFDFQGLVEDRMVFTGSMIGVPITRDQGMVV
jgi:3-hydroxyacyl-[acyl-carrier-protein] dehydratase